MVACGRGRFFRIPRSYALVVPGNRGSCFLALYSATVSRYHLDHLSTRPPSSSLNRLLLVTSDMNELIRRFIASGARPFCRAGINHIPGGGGGPVPRLLLSHASPAAGDGAQHLQLVGGLPRGRRGDTLPPDQAERGGDGAEDRGGRGPLRLPR